MLHISDLDRHGEQITRVLRRDPAALCRDVGGRKPPQDRADRRTRLPRSTPAREVHEGIQVDAIRTPRLREILREAITSRMHQEILDGVLALEVAERAGLRELLRGAMSSMTSACPRSAAVRRTRCPSSAACRQVLYTTLHICV